MQERGVVCHVISVRRYNHRADLLRQLRQDVHKGVITLRVAATYSLSEDQNEKAEKIFKIMARKFCKEPDVWTQLGQFYFKTGNLKDARLGF